MSVQKVGNRVQVPTDLLMSKKTKRYLDKYSYRGDAGIVALTAAIRTRFFDWYVCVSASSFSAAYDHLFFWRCRSLHRTILPRLLPFAVVSERPEAPPLFGRVYSPSVCIRPPSCVCVSAAAGSGGTLHEFKTGTRLRLWLAVHFERLVSIFSRPVFAF